ncbi:MAG: cytosine permease [Coriobacteriales bacterium]|nr:cytosine permease [Coriobacteriales bacterium]
MSEKGIQSTVFEDDAFVPVPESERHGWWKTSFVWAGSSICVPVIMIGAMLIAGLNMAEMIIATIIGSAILSVIFCLQGMEGTDTGLPTAIVARSAFGKEGAAVLISLALATTLVSWAGYDAQVAGESFLQILALNDVTFNREATIIILGLIMLTVSIVGEKFITKLNLVAVPALILLCIYGIVSCWGMVDIVALFTAEPPDPISLIEGITLVVGAQAVGSTIAPDYHRFCRNRKESCLAILVGIPPYLLFLMFAGAIMGSATGESDITMVIANLGIPIIGLIVLVLATWTTMATDAYTGGLAITSLLHLRGTKRALATAIAGICGILLALFGIMDYFSTFLDLMASCIPPIAGVMIADYWILKKGKPENWHETKGVNWLGIISVALGVVAALFVPFGIPTINGVVVALVAYLILMSVAGKTVLAGPQE